jgi:hypothetical protein
MLNHNYLLVSRKSKTKQNLKRVFKKIKLISGIEENEFDEEQKNDKYPLNKQLRRKQSSLWKQLLYCGIEFFF